MSFFWVILFQNIIPLSVLIAIGIVLYRAFKLDIKTLSKLNFYLFSPAIIFLMLYNSKVSVAVIGQVLLFLLLFLAASYGLTEIVIRLRRYPRSMAGAMRNSVLFYNSGNYAVPLNGLVFKGDATTLSIQIIVMMVQNLIPNTYGVYSVNAHKADAKEIWRTILTFPAIYIIPLAFLLRGFEVPIPQPILTPIEYVANSFIATALVTLGVQLGSMKWKIYNMDVLYSVALRLLAGPVLGAAIVLLLGFEGDLAKALVLSCAVPSSLSSVLLAIEFDNEPEFASQAALLSTVTSTFTVAIVIFCLQFIP
ncbi:AEC family transporter [Paenibacillus turpanensis]|uniref:AEC family transporter n=1 Tax=Paenibacillus turpanensis TaxID=2689078 RepID=UPI001407AB08|nr:AEC family transporter [Paenibacillus turpanensis]